MDTVASQQPRQMTCVVNSFDDTHREAPSEVQLVIVLVPGDWVLVRYYQLTFLGEVKNVGLEEVKVSVMVPSGSMFKWPAVEDTIYYRIVDVIKKLTPPIVKSSRGTFQFNKE
jgi:hypothetical protein